MKMFGICLALLMAFGCGAAAGEAAASVIHNAEDSLIVSPQDNRNGWVNPEDLAPMPQCVAHQNQNPWLSALTRCTGRQCTRHFGVICTHHQWLTQLSCLSTAFSPEVVNEYLTYCSRSVLAKAQLYFWVRQITGRTWLVDVGDANELQQLSPRSLTKGYAATDVTFKAPPCLWRSASATTMEHFQSVIASCGFTSTTQHTGNAARPWEYSESLRSIISLDSQTVGYDLTRGYIAYGDYYDKACFCDAFTINWNDEPCSSQELLDLTRERLWMHATCGRASLPVNWTDPLKTIGFAYIPTEAWQWPKCVTDMSEQILKLPKQCTTKVCDIDSDGFCIVKRAVDRACFCRNISYESCEGSCHIFKTRIDYLNWLHGLCGEVQYWHGLPYDWPRLARIVPLDMIPWQWTVKASNNSIATTPVGAMPIESVQSCASKEWKLGSLALINIATVLVACFGPRLRLHQFISMFLGYWRPSGWFFTGLLIIATQLSANWFNAVLVQSTPAYEHVPIISLVLLWCSIPRLTWLPILLVGMQPFEAIDHRAAMSSVFAEIVPQALSSYYMLITFNYGREHNFYLGGLAGAEAEASAKTMYFGALLWLIIFVLALVQLVRATHGMSTTSSTANSGLPKWEKGKRAPSNIAEEMVAQVDERCALLDEHLAHQAVGRTSSRGSGGRRIATYGALPVKPQIGQVAPEALVYPYVVTVTIVSLLWAAQCLLWAGFISIAAEEYCPPNLVLLTVIWTISSVASIMIATT